MVLELRGETSPKSTEALPKASEVSARKPLESALWRASEGLISRSPAGRMTVKEAAGAGPERRVAQAAFRPGVKRDQGMAEIQAKLDVPASTSGQPMPEAVRVKMESAFSADFSSVRIHASSARAVALGALAYTQGSDIHVAPGRWAPETRRGQELLGHELAHVRQQQEGRVRATSRMKGVALNEDAALEAEAEAMSARVLSTSPIERQTKQEAAPITSTLPRVDEGAQHPPPAQRMKASYLDRELALPEDITISATRVPDDEVDQEQVDEFVDSLTRGRMRWYSGDTKERDTKLALLEARHVSVRFVTDPFTDRRIRMWQCANCRNGTQYEAIHLGHVVDWKTHLKHAGVTTLAEAIAAYNNLNNLHIECAGCNTSHAFERTQEGKFIDEDK